MMSRPNPEPISFDDFLTFLSESLLVEKEELTPETTFIDDLQVDSIRWLELAIMIDDLGVELPPDIFWEIQTVNDAYEIYKQYFYQEI